MFLAKQTSIHENPCYDFISSLKRIQNNPGFTPSKNPNRELAGWAQEAITRFPEELRKLLAIFFNQETFYGMSLVGYVARWNPENIEEFLTRLEQVEALDILTRFMYSGIGPGSDFSQEHIRSLMEQDKEVWRFINDQLSFSVQEKWQILQFVMDPETMKQDLLRLLNWHYNNIYPGQEALASRQIQGTLQELKERVQKYGEEYLKLLIPLDYSKRKDAKITLAVSYYWETGQSINILEDVYVFGYRFFEQVEAQHSVLAGVQTFKVLADETRLSIIRLLAGRPWYGHELAERLGVSNSTISHHMTQLVMAGLVHSYREENRVYFQLEPSQFREVLNQVVDGVLEQG
jgi:DNA-binding transcriptional ArsR family regulator